MLINHSNTSAFDPSAREDGNDVILTLSRDLSVDLTRAQAEHLHSILGELLNG
ncbi:hypothetical protein SAMN05444583_10784 [Rhodococcus maanshanensis]|uniref:Uncharacterized protein n=2 Tax=Rhodococcus maanshanensis TaxID=183556 RepID=A0A1H7NNT2_9NOCA|nr:hypothetical protein SAMN05444583_10784 [Rhodococcus maanshanensis]